MVPTKIFFTKGVGVAKDKLTSFEAALRDADIEAFNLVHISSIFPPNCKIISKNEGLKLLKLGEIVYLVLARNETNEPNRLIAAAIGLAQPADKTQYGYLAEHHSFGETEKKAGEYAEDLAAQMLATTLGLKFDPDKAWNEREQFYKASGKIIRTRHVCQSAEGHKNGLWTTVLAAVVTIP